MFVPIIHQFNSMKNKLKVNTKFCNNVSNNNNNLYLNRDVSRVLCKYRVWVGFTRQKCNRLCEGVFQISRDLREDPRRRRQRLDFGMYSAVIHKVESTTKPLATV